MKSVFEGCLPALMTPCHRDRSPDFQALVRKAKELVELGMAGVVYCGSMGDWPLLTDEQRQEGVLRLTNEGIPVVVGTGATSPAVAEAHAAHAAAVGASGLMMIPRLLSRGTSVAAQKNHFSRILSAAPHLPTVIYNSPYYGYETRADLFFELRKDHANLVGFKEFGGAEAMSYAGEQITHADEDLILLAGVDTQVYHGMVNCGAGGCITGVGNCLPREVLHLYQLCRLAVQGDAQAKQYARELGEAMHVLARFDEGPDLVLYYKYLLVLQGEKEYELSLMEDDKLSASQQRFAETQLQQFTAWWRNWPGRTYLGV